MIFGGEFKIWWSATCSKPGICNFKGYTNFVICPCLAPSTGCAPKVESVAFPFSDHWSSFAYFLIIPLSWMDRFHGSLGAWERWLSPPRSHQGGDFPTARDDRWTALRFVLDVFLHHKHWLEMLGPNVVELQGSGMYYLWQISKILDMFNHPLVFPWLLGCFPLAGNQPLKPGVGWGKKYLRP